MSTAMSVGFRLPRETSEIRLLESALHHHCQKRGYEEVMVPCQGAATKDNNRPLRGDLTQMMGLMVSRGYFTLGDEVRLRCSGPIFRGDSEGYQFSAELVNASSPQSDTEVLTLAGEVMGIMGIGRATLIVGYPAALREMLLAGGLTPEIASQAENHLRRQDLVSYGEVLRGTELSVAHRRALSSIHRSMGLEECRKFLEEQHGLHCERMRRLIFELASLPEDPGISVNFGLTGSFDYYTGCVFQGHCGMAGRPVLTGGRYMIHEQPSVGFAVEIDAVVEAREVTRSASRS